MSYRIYPVTPSDISYDGYKIKINGEYVKPDSAKVSAVPFNRRWPGSYAPQRRKLRGRP